MNDESLCMKHVVINMINVSTTKVRQNEPLIEEFNLTKEYQLHQRKKNKLFIKLLIKVDLY